MRSANPIAPDDADCRLAPARRMATCVSVLAVGALGAVWVSAVDVWLQVVFSIVIGVGSIISVIGLIHPSWARIGLRGDRVVLTDRRGRVQEMVVRNRVFVSPLFVGLRLACVRTGKPLRLGIFREQLDATAFRRLAVFLRNPS